MYCSLQALGIRSIRGPWPLAPMLAALTLFFTQVGIAQNKYPSVAEIIKRYDADKDGELARDEVAKSSYARQFPRWDADSSGKVSAKEIIAFRSRFGIAADGSMLRTERPAFSIPDPSDLTRVDRSHRPSRRDMTNSAFVLRTRPHEVSGEKYFILTDHTASAHIKQLEQLATRRDGEIIRVDDLGLLYTQKDAFDAVRSRLRKGGAKYVAIAPTMKSFRENMLLSMWELLSTLDDDPQIDVMPGLLLASNEVAFAKLIQQSIEFKPIAKAELKPFAISQVQRASETRSLQKAGVLRKQFAKSGLTTPIVAIYGSQTDDAPRLSGDQVWNLKVAGNRQFVKDFSSPILKTLDNANLIIMHGHGIPGMSCSVDVEGLPGDLSGKILLSGSCFSASPVSSDLPKMRQAPGNYKVEQRDAFVIRAVDNGAVVAFGHQRLSSGFPHLYPVLESWMKGETVGQSYQELLNGLIDLQQMKAGGFVIDDKQKKSKRHPQNLLLYVVIGDPALRPLAKLNP